MIKKYMAIIFAVCFAAAMAGCGGGGGTSSGNTAPVISSFSASKTAVLSDGSDSATLTVAATDADGDSISYSWSASGGTLTRGSATQYTFRPLAAGVYTVTVQAIDGRGGVTTSTKTINSFGANANEGGASGAISVPRTSYRAAGADAPTDSGNTLSAPIEIPGASGGRDLSRVANFAAKGAPITTCDGERFAPAKLVIKLRAGNDLAAFAAANGLTVEHDPAFGPALVSIDSGSSIIDLGKTKEICRAMNDKSEVDYADLNRYNRTMSVPNDPGYASQWHYNLINLPQAWDITTGSNSIIVAVLDTGIVSAHADLSSRLVAGYDFVDDATSACDGNGIDNNPEDVSDSRCLAGAISQTDPRHSGYHGTHVAGTIGAATNNGVGVAGVTWAGKIMPVRVLGAGGGTDYDIIQGMFFAARLANDSGTLPAQKANIINMSIGGGVGGGCPASYSDVFSQMNTAGVTVFVAAGNEESTNGINPMALCNYAVAVAATDRYSGRAWYSNQGAGLTIAAPGGDTSYSESDGIYSTVRNDATGINTSYSYMQGTSMATPHAAGVAALMLAANPALSPTQIATLLAQTATDLGPVGSDTQFGAGLINAYSAVLEAKRLAMPVVEPVSPVLAVSTTDAYFAESETSKQVVMTNTGIGTLSISSISDTESSGGNWLSTSYTSSGGNVYLTLTANRTGLAVGTYYATVSIVSNGGNSTISVTMQVGATTPTAPVGCLDTNIYILAVDPSDFTSVAQASVALTATTYNVLEVPAGNYYLVAGTDCDMNDLICDQDKDYCGIYPLDSDPQTVDIAAQQFTSGLNLNVSKVTARNVAAPTGSASALIGRSFRKIAKK